MALKGDSRRPTGVISSRTLPGNGLPVVARGGWQGFRRVRIRPCVTGYDTGGLSVPMPLKVAPATRHDGGSMTCARIRAGYANPHTPNHPPSVTREAKAQCHERNVRQTNDLYQLQPQGRSIEGPPSTPSGDPGVAGSDRTVGGRYDGQGRKPASETRAAQGDGARDGLSPPRQGPGRD